MVIYSGLNDNGETVIFDYMVDTLDAVTRPTIDYEFTYRSQAGEQYEEVDVSLPEISSDSMNSILTEVKKL